MDHTKKADSELKKALKELETRLYTSNHNSENIEGLDSVNPPNEVEPYFIIDAKKRWCVTNNRASIIPYRFDYYVAFGWSTSHILWRKAEGFLTYIGIGLDSISDWQDYGWFYNLHKALKREEKDYVYVDSLPEVLRRKGRNSFPKSFERRVRAMTGPSLEVDLVIEFLKEQGYLDAPTAND